MRKLEEYNSDTSVYELYHFLAEAIMRAGLQDFSSLLSFAKTIPIDEQTGPVFKSLAVLIRKLYWGFFKDINQQDYPKVWKEIVLPNPRFPDCGDLKRNHTISNIFVAILDIHGYTAFCDKHKNNLSMLKDLDELIQVQMTDLARSRDVVLQRRHGDEMILVGTSATDITELTLDIVDAFGKSKRRKPGGEIGLPQLNISAGIAGGNKFTPFIITLDGDLSGGVVNTAARLQSWANKLSGARSRIIVGRTVHSSYQSENNNHASASGQEEQYSFIDTGYIHFKGINVAVSELLFDESDKYRRLFENELKALIKSIENQAWRDEIFESLITLLARVFKTMPLFNITVRMNGIPTSFDNAGVSAMALEVLSRFTVKQDFVHALEGLDQLLGYARSIPGFDSLTLEYANLVASRYRILITGFESRLKQRMDEVADTVLPIKHRKLYAESRMSAIIQDNLLGELKKAMPAIKLLQLWSATVDAEKVSLDLSIYAGK